MKINELLTEEVRWVLYINNKPVSHYSSEIEATDQAAILVQSLKDNKKQIPTINIEKKQY